ncbi:FAD-dependent oxidoreductase [Glacieibacterium frigidum]|uniref:FAD-dependent monooxygenase n=1 Tax=Glacieibacterium frigidum TaxID=2593303 RepID=A0A552UF49_9SPHN|nr:NAD(P)/FAD-dependent oxidoreductase [Glacieibacterium frigidum]TRW16821.1 FAD-dependent monooxygenase [Glacieibacterium frigidum]
MRSLDIAVAGCGPAGLAAALLLHRDGHRVRLFERFAHAGPVGSGLMLQPTGLAVLDALGLGDAARAAGRRIDRLYGSADGRTVLDMRYAALSGDRHGVGIHRATLFDLLFDRVQADGIEVETDRAVAGTTNAEGRYLRFTDGSSAGPFDLVVDALGSRTPLAKPCGRDLAYGALWASLDWPAQGFDGAALEQRYRAASVMAGVLPIGTTPGAPGDKAAFFWSLRADRLPAWHAAGLDAWRADVAALWPAAEAFTAQIDDPAQLTFARYTHRTLARPVAPALVHIGDAWHSTSPQLGQGANMALLDAYAVAAALRAARSPDDALARFVALRGLHIRVYQAMSALFTPVYQSDSRVIPWLRDAVVGPLAGLWPVQWLQATMVTGLVGAPLRRLGL